MDGSIRIMMKTENASIEHFKHSSVNMTSLKKSNDTPAAAAAVVRHGQQGTNKIGASLKSSEARRNSRAQKLWDGSLQLNSSLTASVVAFFKSGEKMPDVKWSEFVEVKGKVRLAAFEKYIQDLTRSRNRGLMVTSLCWKEGTSKSGLAGMKKVANGYKEGGRVGLARISEGIDLYICPRSDAIITILAKHGFFKGMAAIEENQDSLIGCVVWRRTRASSDSTKKPETKNQSLTEKSLNGLSDFANRRVGDSDLACKLPVKESVPVAEAKDCPTRESAGSNGFKDKNIETCEVQLELQNFLASTNVLQTPSLLGKPTSIAGPKTSTCSDFASPQKSVGQFSEAPHTQNLGSEKPQLSLEIQRAALSLPSVVTKDRVSTPGNDDDLPEFDFGAAHGKFQALTRNPTEAATVYRTLLTDNYENIKPSLPPKAPPVGSMPAFNKRKLENVNRPSLSTDAIMKLPRLKEVSESHHAAALPSLGEHVARSRALMSQFGATAVPTPKNLFGGDMPEWCPPEIRLHRPLVSQSSSTTSTTSKAPISPFGSLYRGRPCPPLTAYMAFSTQAFPHVDQHPKNFNINPVQRRPVDGFIQRDPSSLRAFRTSTPVRPPANPFDARLAIPPFGWKTWRL